MKGPSRKDPDLMAIEIIGMVGTKEVSETRGSLDGPQIDPGYLTRFARAHEAAGFDRVLIGYGATGPDGFAVAAHGPQARDAGPAQRRRPGGHPPHHRRRRARPEARR
jgi:alkanesulfonate monooxygenase